MSCSRCGTAKPEATDTWVSEDEFEPPTPVYWFLVRDDQPAEPVGIEEGGDLAMRFRVCENLEHPDIEPGERVLCGDCFEDEFPFDLDEDDEAADQGGAG